MDDLAAESERRYSHAIARLKRIEATTSDPEEAMRAARRIRRLKLLGENEHAHANHE
jgi:hypothetical protein